MRNMCKYVCARTQKRKKDTRANIRRNKYLIARRPAPGWSRSRGGRRRRRASKDVEVRLRVRGAFDIVWRVSASASCGFAAVCSLLSQLHSTLSRRLCLHLFVFGAEKNCNGFGNCFLIYTRYPRGIPKIEVTARRRDLWPPRVYIID